MFNYYFCYYYVHISVKSPVSQLPAFCFFLAVYKQPLQCISNMALITWPTSNCH